MSYDLFFHPRCDRHPPGARAMRSYFDSRRHYQTDENRAAYYNEDTHVYFYFDFAPGSELAFNVNYYRSHVFGLEAEPEVAAFINAFDLTVSDPQMDGMGEGRYSRVGFLRGWNTGNRIAAQAILSMDNAPTDIPVLPATQVERYWRWNYQRCDFQERLGPGIFVPCIMFFRRAGRLASFATWTDASPLALPKVDYLILARYDLATRPLEDDKPDMGLLNWTDLARLPLPLPTALDLDRPCLLAFEEAPAAVVELFRTTPTIAEKLEGVGADTILDEELVRECQPASSSIASHREQGFDQ